MGRDGYTERLEAAVELAEAGQKGEAEAQLRELLAEGARLPKATMALGVLCGERGDRAQRRLWLQEARRLEEANGHPLSLRLLLNLLVDALEQGEPEQALAYGEEALALYPGDGEVQLHHARVLFALGQREDALPRLQEACACLRIRLQEHPEDVKAWRLLAMAEQNAEHVDAAIEAHSRALALDPNHLPSLLGIGRLLIIRGQSDEALPWLMNGLAIAPDNPDVLTLNGIALRATCGIDEALPLLREALQIDAAHKEACLQLGDCLCDQGLFSEAAETFRGGLETLPDDLDLKSALAAALRNMGDLESAVGLYREVLEAMPESQVAFHNLMFAFSISEHVSPIEALDTALRFWERKGIKSRAVSSSSNPTVRGGKRPLKVGVLSADIGSHVVGRFLDPILRYHDSSRCVLELISMKRRYESNSEELIELADNVHSLEGLAMAQARDYLKQQNYDLILDTSGYTRGSGLHLLAERCAPVQAHYIGYHATTGLPTIDWFIGDGETAAPELQEQFSERLWRLPRPWLAYPSHVPFPDAQSLVDTDRLVLGCFCQVSKISGATLVFWGEILRRMPEALLVLKDRGLQDKVVRDQLEEKLEKQGIRAERIRFLPPVPGQHDHLDFYNILDIALDTTPWSSATTGFEALGMGVPLVAIRGDCTASRMSCSLLKGLGRERWVADTPERAADIVEELGRSPKEIRDNKKRLQQKVAESVLWDGKSLSKVLMSSFERMCS
ncbi:MAG: tetratricopeptide repeat protein [Cyanobacteriota bacterium]|nr:tetratricopeptide repeat protein [Cyanobacteriota bacterium]